VIQLSGVYPIIVKNVKKIFFFLTNVWLMFAILVLFFIYYQYAVDAADF